MGRNTSSRLAMVLLLLNKPVNILSLGKIKEFCHAVAHCF
jgi:hypothetical protein